MFLIKQARAKFAFASLSLLLIGQTAVVPAALALPGSKQQNFQLPANSSLDESGAAEASGTAGGEEAKPGTILPPLTLTGDDAGKQSSAAPAAASEPASTEAAAAESENATKLEASKNEFVPKGPSGEDNAGLAPASVVAHKKAATADKAGKDKKGKKEVVVNNDNVMDVAKKVNAQPLALQSSQAETVQKIDMLENGEQKQIAQLWEATLQRSPDIQFVVQKLVPSSDPNHTSTILMRLTTSALYAGVGAFGTVMPGQSTYAIQNSSAQLLNQIAGFSESKKAKAAVLNQSELIALYQMVRNTADKMVDHYRDYKKCTVAIQRATADFEDLKAMAAESTARPLETEYTLRKQKRDIDSLADDVHRYRQNLIDMAGSEAVDKLDHDIAMEMQMLGETTVAVNGSEPLKVSEPAIKMPTAPKIAAPPANKQTADSKKVQPTL